MGAHRPHETEGHKIWFLLGALGSIPSGVNVPAYPGYSRFIMPKPIGASAFNLITPGGAFGVRVIQNIPRITGIKDNKIHQSSTVT